MARVSTAGLQNPPNARLLVDFTAGGFPDPVATGSAGAGDRLVYDNFSANALNRTYTIDGNGLGIHFNGATTGQVAHISYRPATPFDLSRDDFLAVEFDVLEGQGDFANILQVYLTTQTGTTYTNYGRRSLNSPSDKIPRRQVAVIRFSESGWTLTSGGPTGFPTNMQSVGKIDFNVTVQAASTGGNSRTYIRRVWVGKNRTKVMFSYDDAHEAQETIVAPMLTAAGFKATLCASSGYINTANKLTDAMLSSLYNTHGWDFGLQQTRDTTDIFLNRAASGSGLTRSGSVATWTNTVGTHLLTSGQNVTIAGAVEPEWNATFGPITVVDTGTFTFPCAGTETTPATGYITTRRMSDQRIKDIIEFERNFYASRGFPRGGNFLAYSNGIVGELVLDAVASAGVVMARSTNTGAAPMTRIFDPRGSTPRSMLMLPAGAMDQATAATVLTYVDAAILRGCSIHLYGHNVAAGVGTGTSLTMDSAELQSLVDGLKTRQQDGLLDVVTVSEFLDLVAHGR